MGGDQRLIQEWSQNNVYITGPTVAFVDQQNMIHIIDHTLVGTHWQFNKL